MANPHPYKSFITIGFGTHLIGDGPLLQVHSSMVPVPLGCNPDPNVGWEIYIEALHYVGIYMYLWL